MKRRESIQSGHIILRWIAFAMCMCVVMFACSSDQAASNVFDKPLETPCKALFGRPTKTTGLDATQCSPTCECKDATWSPPTYDDTWIADIRRWKLLNPPSLLKDDPYKKPAPTIPKDSVCGMKPDDTQEDQYELKTYENKAAAEADGARVTHFGACGLCSSLKDLAVYMANPDLTEPVRQCALKGLGGDDEAARKCLEDIGFSQPCAQIWFYNTTHTRKACLSKCVSLLSAPHHNKDGSLNECIQCDEDKSGPVFKAISGRTRRNSGLASALCRPCESVRPVTHRYRALSGEKP